MLSEGRHFAKLADNIVVKVAMSENGLEAIKRFRAEGIKTNCTLIFSANQGLLAAKAGASLLSPFVGRVDDINEEGMIVIRELAEIVNFYDLDSEVLSASIRHPRHVTESALAGAHVYAAVQGPPADDPPPADRHRHHAVQEGLGGRPRGDGRQGLGPGPRGDRSAAGRLAFKRADPQWICPILIAPTGNDTGLARS
jgi:hypothetical protein